MGLPGNPTVEYLQFQLNTFNLSDDLDVNGTLTANAKNFVQNHPYDPSLEIVYTTLEGPEAGTFTRGSARLDNGIARSAARRVVRVGHASRSRPDRLADAARQLCRPVRRAK